MTWFMELAQQKELLLALMFGIAIASFGTLTFIAGYWVGRKDNYLEQQTYANTRRIMNLLKLEEPMLLKRQKIRDLIRQKFDCYGYDAEDSNMGEGSS